MAEIRIISLPHSAPTYIHEYVWLHQEELKCKTKIRTDKNPVADEYKADVSNMKLIPVGMYPDPFRLGEHRIILCEARNMDNSNPIWNMRNTCERAEESLAKDVKPEICFLQEFSVLDQNRQPTGWGNSDPNPGESTNSLATIHSLQMLTESILKSLIFANIGILEFSKGSMPQKYIIKIGPAETVVKTCDALIVTRFILKSLSVQFNSIITFDHQTVQGNENRTKLVASYSVAKTRGGGNLKIVQAWMEKIRADSERFKSLFPEGSDEEKEMKKQEEVQLSSEGGQLNDFRHRSESNPYKVAEYLIGECTE